MIKNYLKTALRNIKRFQSYSVLNISGMALGMASAIIIFLWVKDEWSFDRYLKNADNLYRVIEKQQFSGGVVTQFAISPGVLSMTLKEEYPEIIRSARYSNPQFPIQKGNEFIEAKTAIADKDFLNMFDIKFVRGDINSSLNGPNNIVITDDIANKYFKNEDPLGKSLKSAAWVFTITGVVKSMPNNSHIKFDILFPPEFLKNIGIPITDWGYRCYNYIELKNGIDIKDFENKITDFINKNRKGSNSEISLQNVKKIHLFSAQKYEFDLSGHGDIAYVGILSLVAVFILIIACINFMNLSTVMYSRRAREISIRKVNGSGKIGIFIQFFEESLLIVLISGAIAMIMVELILPGYNHFIGKQLSVNYHNIELYADIIIIVLFCGLLAGSYPSFYMASLTPIEIMKGIVYTKPGNTKFRSALVIFQFSLSILLIICTLIVYKQVQYLQKKNLGYNRDNIGYFLFDTNPKNPQLETFKKELCKNPDIVSVTRAHNNPINVEGTWTDMNWSGKKEGDNIKFYILGADEDYAKTFHLEIKEGRFFSSDFSNDNTGLVINEESAKMMGLKNPVGEIISTRDGVKFTVIGVVKDFNFKSLHTRIEPLIMCLESCNTFYIRMRPDKLTSTIDYVNKTYRSFNNPNPLNFHFLDEDFENLYRSEQKAGKILSYFSFLATVISCLGLIGLSSFMTQRRTKEIGIRKINGARSGEIYSMLSGEYMIWVLISIVIACPLAMCVMNKWLQNFAYRINLSWWVFALAGLLAVMIALLTVSIQSYRAANKNPVEALRYE